MPARNKLRLYLGFWKRLPSDINPELYHVGLILCPKAPKNSPNQVMLYHATNTIDQKTASAPWRFEWKSSFPRTSKLAGVMLLCKIQPNVAEEDLREILKAVFVPEFGQEGDWRCRNWLIDAMELLKAKGIIPDLPNSAKEVVAVGNAFIWSKLVANQGHPNLGDSLYTCNISGEEIPSEIPSMT